MFLRWEQVFGLFCTHFRIYTSASNSKSMEQMWKCKFPCIYTQNLKISQCGDSSSSYHFLLNTVYPSESCKDENLSSDS